MKLRLAVLLLVTSACILAPLAFLPGNVSAVTVLPAAGSESTPTCTPARIQSAKQVLEQELSDRTTQLQVLHNRIANTKDIPGPDASTLYSIVSTEQTGIVDGGIEGLESVVSSATSCLALIQDARAMVDEFRVYAVVSPQVDLTAVASAEVTIDAQMVDSEPKIEAAISSAGSRGKSVSGADSAYSDMESKLSAAENSVHSVSIASLLGERPSSYPADAAILTGYHEDLVAGGTYLRGAFEDLQTIVTDLR